MIDIEAVKAESIEHSNNLSDWNNEALLKEVLWALSGCIKNNYRTVNKRYLKALEELDKRIYEKTNQPHLTDRILWAQRDLGVCIRGCGNTVKRNAELRKIEEILEIKTPISDILLP